MLIRGSRALIQNPINFSQTNSKVEEEQKHVSVFVVTLSLRTGKIVFGCSETRVRPPTGLVFLVNSNKRLTGAAALLFLLSSAALIRGRSLSNEYNGNPVSASFRLEH